MTIAEMHINFRQYAQQMGMQNVRAILPEQIDILLNQSITDTVNQLIRENIGVTNDRVVTDNSKIGQINAFRTLYKVKEIPISFANQYLKTTTTITTEGGEEITNVVEEIVSIAGQDSDITEGNVRTIIKYTALGSLFTYSTQDRLSGKIKHVGTQEANVNDALFGTYMFFVDMSINYTAVGNETILTAWYPVRIVDDAYLSDTLNDFILKNRFRSPVGVIYDNNTLELYIDKFDAGNNPVITISSGSNVKLTPKSLRISTVQKPKIVRYTEDISEGSSIDCDLPESMHGDIVKHAVDLYRVAVNGSLQASQDAEQAQQRENVRNNYRNEGNQ